jgi:hypothetical protein
MEAYNKIFQSRIPFYAARANPKFAILPRRDPVKEITVTPAGNALTLAFTAPSATSVCTVEGTGDSGTGSRRRTATVAASSHSATISCSDDYYGKTTARY